MNATVIIAGIISLIAVMIALRAIGRIFKFIILLVLVACVALWVAVRCKVVSF